jgi:hypothetical protein
LELRAPRLNGNSKELKRLPESGIGEPISNSRELFPNQLQFFMPFVPFMLFLFRLVGNRSSVGVVHG